ncbi:hypothetical protein N9L76_04635 [bacterium]|nr:hypothetical protein [bacterium]
MRGGVHLSCTSPGLSPDNAIKGKDARALVGRVGGDAGSSFTSRAEDVSSSVVVVSADVALRTIAKSARD